MSIARRKLVAIAALLGALAAPPAGAQFAGSGATAMPGLSAVPKAPDDLRLPGHDPRQCGTTRWSALCASGRWVQFAKMDLTLKTRGFSGAYSMERPESGEVLTTYLEHTSEGRRGGEVLLISDSAFAFRTREQLPTDDDILDYMLGAPNMAMQLASLLLDQGVLEAPSDVTAPRTITAANAKQFLRTETPTTAALYGPPWRMTGSVRPAADDRLAFTLRFTFHPVAPNGKVDAARTQSIDITGTVAYANRRKAMPDSFDLVGWKLMQAGEPLPAVSTLAEARAATR